MPNEYLLKSRESLIIDENYGQSTHDIVTSNAAATRRGTFSAVSVID